MNWDYILVVRQIKMFSGNWKNCLFWWWWMKIEKKYSHLWVKKRCKNNLNRFSPNQKIHRILSVAVANSWNKRKHQIDDLTGQIINGVPAKYSNRPSKPRYKIHCSIYQNVFPGINIRRNKTPFQCQKDSTPLVIITHCRNINSTGPMGVWYSSINLRKAVKIFFHTRIGAS